MTMITGAGDQCYQFRSSFQEIKFDSTAEGVTLLMYACQQENVEQLRLILEKNVSLLRIGAEKSDVRKSHPVHSASNALSRRVV